MIVTENVEVKISKKNISHFIEYYKDIKLRDIIKINPNWLQNSSNIKVDVICDICNIGRNIKYQAYYKNINSCKEHNIYTCDKCSHIKIKSFNINKWGVDYFSQTPEYAKKFKKTMVERWGVEYALQSEYLKNKAKKTNLDKFGYENPFMDHQRISEKFNDKYGVSHPSQVESIYKKIENTNLLKFGYKSVLSSPDIREKIKLSNLIKFGGHPMKDINILNKMKNTNLKKYGHEFVLSVPEKRDVIKNTNLEKFGVENPMMSEEIRKGFIISTDANYIKYIGSNYSLFNCISGHEFTIHIDNFHSRTKNKIKLCTVCNPIGDSRSIKEDELYNFISSNYSGDIVRGYRDKLEIDIYLPELKLGLEFNGIYWHSDKYKDKNYHSDKTKYFLEKGIRIIHIWEDDWSFNCDILKSQIKNWLGKNETNIFARRCKVVQLKSVSNFLNNNHVQGFDRSSLKLGLYYNDELVSVMTFNNFEGRKKMTVGGWNISRFCNKIETSVVGGASKLLKYFIKNYNPIRIVSYADRDWSIGCLYYQLGFSNINESLPDYKYVVDNRRVHKSNFKKSKLKYNCTENEYINSIGVYKIWDCGKIKFELNL